MQIERELKFRLSPASVRSVWRLARFVARPRQKQIVSVYYDTPGARLRRSGAALRLRREGGRWLQTLKAEAGPQAGLAARAEWELAAPGRRLDLGAFPRESIMAATGLDLRSLGRGLKPLFETRFTRRAGIID
ncbi:MAG: CYTH domain-containing protein, partial [Pseudomonadota bacterium]